jgi:hypothetical protein
LSVASRKRFEDRFSIEKMVEGTLAAYGKCLPPDSIHGTSCA